MIARMLFLIALLSYSIVAQAQSSAHAPQQSAGEIRLEGPAAELAVNDEVRKTYLGIH